MDSRVKQTLTGSTKCVLKNQTDLESKKPSSFTAIITGVDKVYALFPGSVQFFGYYNGLSTLNVLVTNHEILRYLNLSNMEIWKGAELTKGQYIGLANKRTGLGIEYCTQWQGNSKYPVRVGTRTYFKQNPKDILNGLYVPPQELEVLPGITRPDDKTSFNEDQLFEWGSEVEIAEYEANLRNATHSINPISG